MSGMSSADYIRLKRAKAVKTGTRGPTPVPLDVLQDRRFASIPYIVNGVTVSPGCCDSVVPPPLVLALTLVVSEPTDRMAVRADSVMSFSTTSSLIIRQYIGDVQDGPDSVFKPGDYTYSLEVGKTVRLFGSGIDDLKLSGPNTLGLTFVPDQLSELRGLSFEGCSLGQLTIPSLQALVTLSIGSGTYLTALNLAPLPTLKRLTLRGVSGLSALTLTGITLGLLSLSQLSDLISVTLTNCTINGDDGDALGIVSNTNLATITIENLTCNGVIRISDNPAVDTITIPNLNGKQDCVLNIEDNIFTDAPSNEISLRDISNCENLYIDSNINLRRINISGNRVYNADISGNAGVRVCNISRMDEIYTLKFNGNEFAERAESDPTLRQISLDVNTIDSFYCKNNADMKDIVIGPAEGASTYAGTIEYTGNVDCDTVLIQNIDTIGSLTHGQTSGGLFNPGNIQGVNHITELTIQNTGVFNLSEPSLVTGIEKLVLNDLTVFVGTFKSGDFADLKSIEIRRSPPTSLTLPTASYSGGIIVENNATLTSVTVNNTSTYGTAGENATASLSINNNNNLTAINLNSGCYYQLFIKNNSSLPFLSLINVSGDIVEVAGNALAGITLGSQTFGRFLEDGLYKGRLMVREPGISLLDLTNCRFEATYSGYATLDLGGCSGLAILTMPSTPVNTFRSTLTYNMEGCSLDQSSADEIAAFFASATFGGDELTNCSWNISDQVPGPINKTGTNYQTLEGRDWTITV